MQPLFDGTFHLDPIDLIGRRTELEQILEAIRQRGRRYFYLDGKGGIGKTYLLRAVIEHSESIGPPEYQKLLRTDIIDLYHVRYHQPIALMGELARRIRAKQNAPSEPFKAFVQAEATYYQGRGSTSEQQLLHDVERAFLLDYTQLAQDYRILVTIDTLEKLDFTIAAEADADLPRFDQRLLALLEQLPNTVVVLAGRPRPRQSKLIEDIFGPACRRFTVKPFNADQTRAYAEQVFEHAQQPVDALDYQAIYDETGGEPIALILYLSCYLAQGGLRPYPLPESAEPAARKQALHTAFRNQLETGLATDNPAMFELLKQAVFLRKGIDVTILQALERAASAEELRDRFEQFQKMPIVKKTQADRVILHDEIYDLLFGATADLERDGRECLTQIKDYLKKELQETQNTIRDEPTPSAQLFQELQVLQIEYLFYCMAENPVAGYQDYRELTLSTIMDRDADFDRQLLSELGRFLDLRPSPAPAPEHAEPEPAPEHAEPEPQSSWGEYYTRQLEHSGIYSQNLAYDQQVFTVYRKLNLAPGTQAERVKQAQQVAATTRKTYADVYTVGTVEQAMLAVAELEARVFDRSQDPEQINADYEAAIATLEKHPDNTLAKLIRALGYSTRGFFERNRQRNTTAITYYSIAIQQFQPLGQEADKLRAITLTNLSFVLNLQGNQELGHIVAERALAIFNEVGSTFRAALTRNTLARIQLELDQVEQALLNVQQARKVLEGFGQTRELGLCAYAEGEIRRWYAHAKSTDYAASLTEYGLAINRYAEARDILAQGGERIRQIEVLQGLGCAYRGRAQLHRLHAQRDKAEQDKQEALSYFEQALKPFGTDEKAPLKTSILEDIAVCFVDEDDYATAMAWLGKAEASIPDDYNILVGYGTGKNPDATRQDRSFWLQRGQIELQKALCAFGKKEYEQFCVAMLRAFGAVLEFAPQSRQVATFRMLAHKRLLQIPMDDLGKAKL
ncbi:ATP-binding protein, partial [bacterium]|nr:ATP-binding protein [bacterium]